MYDDFYQADSGSSRFVGGLGLGLPIALGLLQFLKPFEVVGLAAVNAQTLQQVQDQAVVIPPHLIAAVPLRPGRWRWTTRR